MYTPGLVSDQTSGLVPFGIPGWLLLVMQRKKKEKKFCRIFVSEFVHLSCQIPKISGTDASSDCWSRAILRHRWIGSISFHFMWDVLGNGPIKQNEKGRDRISSANYCSVASRLTRVVVSDPPFRGCSDLTYANLPSWAQLLWRWLSSDRFPLRVL